MEKNRLGKTELLVTPLGFGGIPIQRINQTEAVELIHSAIDKGVNFFDSARRYTDGEEKFGLAFKGLRDKIILATKSMGRTGKDMAAEVDLSLNLLQTDYIDLYQCHNVRTEEDWEKLKAPGGGLEVLEKAQQEGKVRFIGITAHKPEIMLKALREYSFTTAQFPYNYIEQQNKEELLAEIKRQDLGSIIMKPLAGGALSQAGPALRFLLNQGFSVVIPGMDSKEQLEENLSQLQREFSKSDEELLNKEREVLGQQFCRRCEYCLPCTAGIDIPLVFLNEGYYNRYGLKDWAEKAYQGLAVKADQCTDCGMCESRCPYQLPIREKLRNVHTLLGK